MMQRLSSSLARSVRRGNVSRGLVPAVKEGVPGGLMRGAMMGFVRNSSFASGFSPLERKPLGSILDVNRAQNMSPEDLASAWDDYHLGRGHLGATMKANLYGLFEQRGRECQYFVIPIRRGSGYLTMFSQVVKEISMISHRRRRRRRRRRREINGLCSFMSAASLKQLLKAPYVIFTGLEDYKSRGTQASPYFTVSHYTEFAESKDLVLVRGDVVFTSKLTDEEAKLLLETTQSFYLNDARYSLVEKFNKQTSDFEFKDVLRALNMPIL